MHWKLLFKFLRKSTMPHTGMRDVLNHSENWRFLYEQVSYFPLNFVIVCLRNWQGEFRLSAYPRSCCALELNL